MFVRPLWVHGEIDVEKIRAAKAELDLPYRIKPHERVHGSIDGRVLAWGTRPSYACAYVLVTDGTDLDGLMDAVAWALGEREDDDAMTVEDCLKAWLGPDVREIPAEELASERRLAEYEAGL